METINPTYSYLTNLEVMQILQKIKSTKKKFGMRNLATVTYEALQYLEETPCKTQTRESIINYVKDLSSYRLKSHEVLQMVNDPPTSALHTQLLIDDNKAPLTDEENEKIIQLSYKHFHGSGDTKEAPTEPTARQKSTAKSAAAAATKAAEAEAAEAPASNSAAEPEVVEAQASASQEKAPEAVETPAESTAEESQPETETTAEAKPTEAEAMETDDKDEPENQSNKEPATN